MRENLEDFWITQDMVAPFILADGKMSSKRENSAPPAYACKSPFHGNTPLVASSHSGVIRYSIIRINKRGSRVLSAERSVSIHLFLENEKTKVSRSALSQDIAGRQ